LRRHIQASNINKEQVEKWLTLQVLQFVVSMDFLESVTNLCLALKLFLTICISVATCERNFSKLKIVKNYLRSMMSQMRLNGLAILSTENQLAMQINFNETISQFADVKARRKTF
jgi:hypothetical protein